MISSSLTAQQKDNDLLIHYGAFKTYYYSGINEISVRDFKREISQNPVAYEMFNRAHIMYRVGGFFYGVSLGAYLVSFNLLAIGTEHAEIIYLGSMGTSIITAIIYYTGKRKLSNAILVYNSKNNASISIENRGLNLGLVYKF